MRRLLSFWILSRHPGDVYQWSNEAKYRVGIDAKDVIALFDIRDRAGQSIGMPRISSVISALHRFRA